MFRLSPFHLSIACSQPASVLKWVPPRNCIINGALRSHLAYHLSNKPAWDTGMPSGTNHPTWRVEEGGQLQACASGETPAPSSSLRGCVPQQSGHPGYSQWFQHWAHKGAVFCTEQRLPVQAGRGTGCLAQKRGRVLGPDECKPGGTGVRKGLGPL